MARDVNKNTFSEEYNDDFSDSAGYHKILFNGGRALQQRELNQLQSIINKEVASIGTFLFQGDGSKVTGAKPTCGPRQFIKIDTAAAGTANVPTNVQDLKGLTFTEAGTGVAFTVNAVVAATATDPLTLYVTYIDADDDSASSRIAPLTISTAVTPSSLTSGSIVLVPQSTNTVSNPRIGQGVVFSVTESRYFIRNHFVFTPNQDLVLSKYNKLFAGDVGFIVSETVETVNDNQNLYDNSGTQLNLAAPGADRYKISLTLAKEDDITDEHFVAIAHVRNGLIVKDKSDAENNIGDGILELVRERTKFAHGDFAVKNFMVNFSTAHDSTGALDSDNLAVRISAGFGYIDGHRFGTFSDTEIKFAKPRSTEIITNRRSGAEYGNYFVLSNLYGIPDINNFGMVYIKSATSYGGSIIGKARVRAIEEFGSNYKLYLFDVRMNTGVNLSTARSVGTSSTNYGDIKLEPTGVAELKDKRNNNLFFDLPFNRPRSLSDITLTVQSVFQETPTANTITLLAGTGFTWDNTGDWIVTRDDTGAVVTPSSISGSGTSTATISGLVYTGSHTIAAYRAKTGVIRPKTLTNRIQTGLTPASDGTITLDKGDIYVIDSARDEANDLVVTGRYILDNGQRDNFYGMGKLILKGGTSAPAGNVKVAYKYFDHNISGSGDFFAVNSYNTGEIAYENIPSFRQANGETVQLRDVLDFRPLRNTADSDFQLIHKLPEVGDTITFDEEVYLGAKGRIFAHKDNFYRVDLGKPSLNPALPEDDLKDKLELATFTLNPYMLDDEDMSLSYVDNRRYTMRDIGKLDRRIGELEELTALTLLELDTKNIDVLDSLGVNRFKSGITADKFRNHAFSDTTLSDYRASIDPIKNELRPSHHTEAVDLIFDSGTNCSRYGDLVMIDHTTEAFMSQLSVSKSIDVQPFQLKNMVGTITLSPATDAWYETSQKADRVVKGDDTFSLDNEKTFDNWDFNWSGITQEQLKDFKAGDVVGERTAKTDIYTQGRRKYQKVETQQYYVSNVATIEEYTGEVITTKYSMPYMRSRFVSFKVQGLRPNTRHFVFLDGTNITQYVNSSPGTAAYTPKGSLVKGSPYLEYDKHSFATQYPAELGGPTAIITDANGSASGFILIPNTPTIRFTVGSKTLRFLDVSQNNLSASTSYATGIFTSTGVLEIFEKELIKYRQVEIVPKSEPRDPELVAVKYSSEEDEWIQAGGTYQSLDIDGDMSDAGDTGGVGAGPAGGHGLP